MEPPTTPQPPPQIEKPVNGIWPNGVPDWVFDPSKKPNTKVRAKPKFGPPPPRVNKDGTPRKTYTRSKPPQPRAKKPKGPTPEETEENIIRAALASSVRAYFAAVLTIVNKLGEVVRPSCNYLQDKFGELYEHAKETGRPFRAMILKPRQKGSSTFSVACCYHELTHEAKRGAIVGGAHDQAANLLKILKHYAGADKYTQNKCEVLDGFARWANGSSLTQYSARNPEVGRSGTFQFLICTEVARWAEEGVANAKAVLAGLLKCVGNEPGTAIILESTAFGKSGDFYERWQDAITPEEWLAGKDGYVKIFAAWFQFPECRRDPALEAGLKQYVKPDQVEMLRSKWGLDDWQIAWMQWAVREECRGDFDVFCQDYPFDEESAFLSSGRRRFNGQGLAYLRRMAEQNPPDYGNLERQKDGTVIWRSCPAHEAMLRRWEGPYEGGKYVLPVDPATGASQTTGTDPDRHGVGVLRAGRWEHGRGWRPPKVVASLPPVEWDIDVLEVEIAKLSDYYGGCLIVPEVNMDRGLIELLKLRGANIYEREQFNRREQKRTKALGWLTNTETRGMIIEMLARAIREWDTEGEGIECFDMDTIEELEHFVIKANGRAEADEGKHDDRVLKLCIGLATLDGATAFARPHVARSLPPDLQRLMATHPGGVDYRGARGTFS
ncbi:MAG: hypothetical protein IAE97_06375 [Chthoniobacterales bacterium]|nr:hypothetical protein [Chthoniobacterales bacterium]